MRSRIISIIALCLFFVGVLVFFGGHSIAQANSNITVTTTVDETNPTDGTCSLREALAAIATGAASGGAFGECPAGSPGDAILVPSGTYTLTQGELVITASLTISGSGQIDTVLDGAGLDRLLENTGTAVNLVGLTFTDGRGFVTTTVPNVGGILNSGALTLTSSTLAGVIGDGLYSQGSLVVQDSVISGSTGSGLKNAGGAALITGTTVASNLNGGIFSTGGLTVANSLLISNTAHKGGGIYAGQFLSLANSTLISNTAGSPQFGGQGGGLYLATGAQAIVQQTDFLANQSDYWGGGIYNAGALTVTASQFISNVSGSNGGGLNNQASLLVISSTFSGNDAHNGGGGGLESDQPARVISSTFSYNHAAEGGGLNTNVYLGAVEVIGSSIDHNSADFSGGGVSGLGQMTVTSSVFYSNVASYSGGGIFAAVVTDAYSSTISNTIVIGNAAPRGGGLCAEGFIYLYGDTLVSNTATLQGGGLLQTSMLLTVEKSLITGNSTSGLGGGIFSWEGVVLRDSTVTSNTASSGDPTSGNGGGIYSWQLLSASGSTITGNTASGEGGGIYAQGALTLANTSLVSNTVTGNTAYNVGGGLYVYTGTPALIQDSLLLGNQAMLGGAVYNLGTVVLSNTSILSNTALDQGVIQNGWTGTPATLTVHNSTFGWNAALDAGSAILNWPPSTLTVTHSSFHDNRVTYAAGGLGTVLNDGSAWVSDSSFDHNRAESGAAIYNDRTLHLSDSTFTHNAATGSGGALVSLNGTVDISGTTFDGNSAGFEGGAVYGEALTLTDTSLVNNTAAHEGGAIASVNGYLLTAQNITVTNNSAHDAGGLFVIGPLQLSGSRIISNSAIGMGGGLTTYQTGTISQTQILSNTADTGGGLYTFLSLNLTNSTLAGNTAASQGGGIFHELGPLTVTNSTVSGNQSAADAGGLAVVSGTAALNSVTLFGNIADYDHTGSGQGGGLLVSPGAVLTASNTIVAGNAGQGGLASDCAGTLTTGGHNLIQSSTGCTLSGMAAGDVTGLAALLGPLQDNGGPTWTQALLPGSPALDAGSPATPGSSGACEATDQRGVARPQGSACDIGAYEAVLLPITATVQFSGSAFTATQSAVSVPITATISQVMPVTVTVQYSTTDGTALAGSDYTAVSNTLTFSPGVTQTAFTVPITPTARHDADKSLSVAISSPSGATLGIPASATVAILNDHPAPTVSFITNAYTVTESAGSAVITATLSAASGLTATVHYATSDGTALAGHDYAAASGTLTFTPGMTQTAFTIPITPTAWHDADKFLSAALSTPAGAALGAPYTATVTILNDHPAPGVSFSSQAYTVTESAGAAAITVTLSAASGLTATVHYATSSGTATAGADYTPVSGTLTFVPGQVQRVFTVPITSVAQAEGPETVLLTLSSPVAATPGSPSTATLTILDGLVEYRVYLSVIRRP